MPPHRDIPAQLPLRNDTSPRTPREPSWEAEALAQSLLPTLLSHFNKVHTRMAEVLSKLDENRELTKTCLNDSRGTGLLSASSQVSPAGISSSSFNLIKSGGSSPGKKGNCKWSDLLMNGSLSDTITACNEHRKETDSILASQKSVSQQSTRTRNSTFEDMETLAHLIRSHSNIYDRRLKWAHQVWVFLENRNSSKWAYFYGSYFAPFFLIASVLISFIQTVDDLKLPDGVFTGVQITFEVWFACEISIRFCCCPNKIMFWRDMFNWIDLVSVLPMFLRLWVWIADIEKGTLLQVIALVPILRLMKILRRFHKFQLLVSAFRIALEALPVLIFSLMFIAILFSGLIFLCESRDLLPSLPDASWFVMVTMSTVGYGDIYPETVMGKLISMILMVLSALYMALPIGIVGNAFSEVWNDRDRLLLLAVLRETFQMTGVSRQLIRDIFLHFSERASEQGSGLEPEMTLPEFQKMLRALQIDVGDERTIVLFAALDVDSGGTISCDEFLQCLFPSAYATRKRSTVMSLMGA